MSTGRKKPIRLEFETQLVSATDSNSESVQIKLAGQTAQSSSTTSPTPREISGTVKLRREVKGRAGKPVSVLFGFSDPHAMHSPSLKDLQARLKEKLACGGTFDPTEGSITLQVDDLKRVRALLETLGFDVKG